MRNTKRTSRYSPSAVKKNTGFYIALGICIVTIAAAAWTTYGSLIEYNSDRSGSSAAPADQEISGESAPSLTEASEDSSQPDTSGTDPSPEPAEGSDSAQPVHTEDLSDAPETSPSEESSAPVISDAISGGVVIKSFSPSDLIYSKTTSDWRTHCGMDISANEGAAVHAIEDGVIQSISRDPFYGNTIVIDHGSCTARYCGLTDASVVTEGSHVTSGDTIGYLGVVPCEALDGSHLHLELCSDNSYLSLESLPSLSK